VRWSEYAYPRRQLLGFEIVDNVIDEVHFEVERGSGETIVRF